MGGAGFTGALSAWVSDLSFDAIPSDGVEIAGQCLVDWVGVTLAGSREPAARIALDAMLEDASGKDGVTVVGRASLLPPSAAALVNGTASHALDYDDANTVMLGHPTVPVLGAVLPLAEARAASGEEALTAFVAGYEAECRVADAMGRSHYLRGFHATGTLGTVGAAAACARLLGLDAARTAVAIGLGATQASGLKAMFGTMGKPFHAGTAAAGGLLAARLAAHGFSAAPDAVEAHQGLATTLGDSFDAARGLSGLGERWYVRGNLFKYHAACYETHSTIEGLRGLRDAEGFAPDDVDEVVIHANDLQLGMCAIDTPTTGLESKFSLRHVAALAVLGEDTSAIDSFDDDRVDAPRVVALRARVTVQPDGPSAGGTPVDVRLRDGRVLHASFDSHVPATDLDLQRDRLTVKARRLAAPVLGDDATVALLAAVGAVADAKDVGDIVRRCRTEEG